MTLQECWEYLKDVFAIDPQETEACEETDDDEDF